MAGGSWHSQSCGSFSSVSSFCHLLSATFPFAAGAQPLEDLMYWNAALPGTLLAELLR